MCYWVREPSKKTVKDRRPEHIVERPVTEPETVSDQGVWATVRNLLHKVEHKKVVQARENEVAEV